MSEVYIPIAKSPDAPRITVTLDPGGFVVRLDGAALEVFAGKWHAIERADTLANARWAPAEPVRLFEPAPAQLPGQLSL